MVEILYLSELVFTRRQRKEPSKAQAGELPGALSQAAVPRPGHTKTSDGSSVQHIWQHIASSAQLRFEHHPSVHKFFLSVTPNLCTNEILTNLCCAGWLLSTSLISLRAPANTELLFIKIFQLRSVIKASHCAV